MGKDILNFILFHLCVVGPSIGKPSLEKGSMKRGDRVKVGIEDCMRDVAKRYGRVR
jgi:hypothetical protein